MLPAQCLQQHELASGLCVSCGTRENRKTLDELAVHGLVRASTLTAGVKLQSEMSTRPSQAHSAAAPCRGSLQSRPGLLSEASPLECNS